MLRIGIAMHVDLVMQLDIEKVYKNGKIKISEYNYNVPLGYGTRIISKSSARNYNYIY